MTFEEFAATLNITPENTPPSSYDLITDAYTIGYEAGKDSQRRFLEGLEKREYRLIKKYQALVDRYNKLGQEKKQDEYKHYRNVFALASIFDNCVKDAQTGQTIDLAELITGIPTPKEPLSYEDFLDMKSKMA